MFFRDHCYKWQTTYQKIYTPPTLNKVSVLKNKNISPSGNTKVPNNQKANLAYGTTTEKHPLSSHGKRDSFSTENKFRYQQHKTAHLPALAIYPQDHRSMLSWKTDEEDIYVSSSHAAHDPHNSLYAHSIDTSRRREKQSNDDEQDWRSRNNDSSPSYMLQRFPSYSRYRPKDHDLFY
jgi:hypothetical protein